MTRRATPLARALRAAPLALAAVSLTAAAGCTRELIEEPRNFVTADNYYGTPADIEASVVSSYQTVFQDAWNRWMPTLGDLASDQTRIQPDEPNFQTYAPGLLLWDPTSNSINTVWNGFYTAIFRANLAIDRAGKVQFPNAADQTRLIAEAKYIRAYSYLQLTKGWDDVPLLLTLADHDKAQSAEGVARTPVNEVHAQVLKDLADAEAGLEAVPRDHGRASKGAAQMAIAELHQWRSSFLKQNEWAQASAAARRVMDSGTWSLASDYLAPFLPANKGYAANKEVVWAVPASGLQGRSSTDAFCLFLPRQLGFGSGGGCEIIGQPTLWMFNSFPAGDYRHQVTYRTQGCSTNASIGCVTLGHPNVDKYRPTNRGIGGPVDVDYPIYRVAEAMLIHAEAQFELGNQAEALRMVNLVRARARQGTGSESRAEPRALASVDREAIYLERNWEMAHEGKRWWDLLRRNALEPGYLVAQLDAHDPETRRRGSLDAFRFRYPIPQNELLLNKAVKQNPGYGN